MNVDKKEWFFIFILAIVLLIVREIVIFILPYVNMFLAIVTAPLFIMWLWEIILEHLRKE